MLLKIQILSVIIAYTVIGLGWLLFARQLIGFLSSLVARLSDSSEQIASASMDEMSSMTKQNSKNAEEA